MTVRGAEGGTRMGTWVHADATFCSLPLFVLLASRSAPSKYRLLSIRFMRQFFDAILILKREIAETDSCQKPICITRNLISMVILIMRLDIKKREEIIIFQIFFQ